MVAAGWLRRLHNPQDTRPELVFPSFQIDRVPYEPWATLADQDVLQGRQPLRPRYAPDDTIWHGHWPQLTPASASARPRFLGAMRIKNEARWLHEVLTRALDLCSEIYVLDDHSTDDTPLICTSFKDRVKLFPSPFQGLDEARDKNYLLEKVIAARPDWVLWIDGDEVLERNGAELLRQAVADGAGDVAAFRLRIAYLWDDCRQVRVDGLWGRFMRPSFFRLQGQPLEQVRFPTSYAAGNFHCGNVPGGLVGEVRPIDVRLKHYGYLTRRQRQAKYDWYTRIDPNNQREDEYRHLVDIPGARYAPGPAVFVSWDE
jgi:glycosyltransferase involved in cell wall biosynthesis